MKKKGGPAAQAKNAQKKNEHTPSRLSCCIMIVLITEQIMKKYVSNNAGKIVSSALRKSLCEYETNTKTECHV